jgi:hypothetical protein
VHLYLYLSVSLSVCVHLHHVRDPQGLVDGTSFDKTRELLEPIISKPKLTDKLLQKPPMRFIFDIVMAVRAFPTQKGLVFVSLPLFRLTPLSAVWCPDLACGVFLYVTSASPRTRTRGQVNQATGFATGLYNEEESVADNMKEKPQKIQFLEKIINTVGIHLGSHCPVRATFCFLFLLSLVAPCCGWWEPWLLRGVAVR